MNRPFWMHQIVEYVLGLVLVASALRNPTPTVPAVVGGLIAAHAAFSHGPAAAFSLISRRVHRVSDVALIAVEVVAAAQPWISVDTTARAVIGAVAIVHLVVWWNTDFSRRPTRAERRAARPAPTVDRSTRVGETAGRAVGQGVRAWRRMRAEREQEPR